MPGPFENRLDNPAIRRRKKLAEAKANREKAFSSPAPKDDKPSVFNRIVDYAKTAAKIQDESFYPTYQATGPNPLAFLGSPTFQRTGIGRSLAGTDIGRRLMESQSRIGEATGGYDGPATLLSRGVLEPTPSNIAIAGLTASEFLPGGRGAKAVKESVKQSRRMGITPRYNYEDDKVKDVFELESPMEDKAFVESFENRRFVSEAGEEDLKILAAIDELVSGTKNLAEEQGIKITDISPWLRTYSHAMSPKDRNALFRLFKPSDEGMDFRISVRNRPNITEIKKAMYNTMRGGAVRQEAYGQTPEMPYTSWKEIADEDAISVIDQMVGNWKVFDADGRLIPGESTQLDHIIDLILGGSNTKLQPMIGRENARKGAKAKIQAQNK
jgi:hypothetical protein